MKTHTCITLALGLACCLVRVASAAAVFYSFDTATDGNGSLTFAPSAIEGFASAASVVRTGTVATGNGGATFTDFQGTIWTGSGNSNTPGHSLNWNQNSTNNSFSVMLDTTGLESLAVQLQVRSVGTSTPTAFSSLSYSIGAGSPVAINTVSLGFVSSTSFQSWTADLSSISALSNQSSISLTWTLPDLGPSPSVRIDNLQISAVSTVPEPSTCAVMAGLVAIGAATFMRRKRL
jgi:hypothetical protein